MAAHVKSTIRVAVVQAGSVAFDVEATVTKLEKLSKQASDNGAQLVLFPEAFIPSYPRFSNFEPIVRCFFKNGQDNFSLYWENAVEVPGPIIDRLSLVAKENKIYLVVGIIEKDGGTLFCTVVFFGNDGKYLGKHRKLMPSILERVLWGHGDGSTLPVFDTPVGKFGAVICWENYMPFLRMAMYSKGIQIYCAPTADDSEEWLSTMRHIALEGRCFVLNCNQFVRRSDFPSTYVDPEHGRTLPKSKDDDYIMCRGGSCIISPMGKFLAGPHYDEQATLYADLDLSEVKKAKFELDVVGHYARPDVFTLHVNEKPNHNVVFHQHQQQAIGECKQRRVHQDDLDAAMLSEQ